MPSAAPGRFKTRRASAAPSPSGPLTAAAPQQRVILPPPHCSALHPAAPRPFSNIPGPPLRSAATRWLLKVGKGRWLPAFLGGLLSHAEGYAAGTTFFPLPSALGPCQCALPRPARPRPRSPAAAASITGRGKGLGAAGGEVRGGGLRAD